MAPRIFCRVLAPDASSGYATILDMSAQGLALALPDLVAPQTILRLQMVNQAQLYSHEVAFRVLHSRGQSGSPCIAGGIFLDPLPHAVLCALLAESE
jgi:hypothetical protein